MDAHAHWKHAQSISARARLRKTQFHATPAFGRSSSSLLFLARQRSTDEAKAVIQQESHSIVVVFSKV